MAEYSERTGSVKWQRVLIASQRELIEKWLRERYPASATAGARKGGTPPVAPVPEPPAQRPAAVHHRRAPNTRNSARRRG